ncbi:MAG TPA: ATP-binding protein [Gemmataceae bacterium]|nr:ATP-binding protein [Gemmataceae bacterium]
MKPLPLRSFRLQNFKAVRDSGAVHFGPLTAFIGNNGSGKSSLVEGLETFRDIVLEGLDTALHRWRGFEYVWNQAVQHDLRRPEGHRPGHSNPMTFRLDLSSGAARFEVRQTINMGEGGNGLFIQEEQLRRRGQRSGGGRLIRDDQGKQTVTSSPPKDSVSHPTLLNDGQSLFRDWFGGFLEQWQFLNLVPDAMGQPMPQQRAGGRVRLARNGSNVAEYLNEIRRLDVAAFDGILDSLRYVLPFTLDLQPTLTSELERAFYLRLKEEDFEVPGWLLSTGTLRILALLACLRHPEPPPLLVVEEVENGLDPRTLHLLVEEIRAALYEGKTQVILTTHSPYLLDLLDLSHIVVVERVDGQPTFTRPDKAALAQWTKSFSPGRLYTMGRLTRGD